MLEDEVDDESNIEAFIVGGYNYTVLVLLPHFSDLKIEIFFSSMLIYPFTEINPPLARLTREF